MRREAAGLLGPFWKHFLTWSGSGQGRVNDHRFSTDLRILRLSAARRQEWERLQQLLNCGLRKARVVCSPLFFHSSSLRRRSPSKRVVPRRNDRSIIAYLYHW